MFLIMLGLNIHLMIKNRNISINRTQRGFALMKATVQDLQSTNEKAVKVLKEVNSLIKVTQEEMFRDQLAGLLVDSLAEENAKVNFFDMVKIVESSQKYAAALSSCPFTYKDILAIGWLESDFKIDAVGTHGERGIWQILAWKQYLSQIRRWDAYDVDTNCCMATMELKYKFETKGNYTSVCAAIVSVGFVCKAVPSFILRRIIRFSTSGCFFK
jgi:hypothetical protein